MDLSTAPVMSNKRSGKDSPPRLQKRIKATSQSLEAEDINTETTTASKVTSSGEHNKPGRKMIKNDDSMEYTKYGHSSASPSGRESQDDKRISDNSMLDTPANQRGFDDNSLDIASVRPASPDEGHLSFHSESTDAYVPYNYDDDGSEMGTPVTTFDDLNQEMGRWTAPQEPLRPKSPYKKGRILEIKKHTACHPFGSYYPYYEGQRECAPERELRGKTLVELCLDRPPVGGETTRDQGPESLEVLEEIRTGDKSGAQIVVCRLSAGREVVAKIYDPLYYGFAHRMWSDQPRDVTYEADMDYSREVAAFSELDDQLGGTDIPRYYGSWTLQLPLKLPNGEKKRDIRLVLMEHIKGTVMTDLKPESFSEPTRMDLVARMIEADSRIHSAGVRHGDVSQRNIIVCLAGPDVVERVVLIDFNYAVVSHLDNLRETSPELQPDPKPDKLSNPINKWWCGALYSKAGEWLPESWEFRLRASQEWLYKRYGKSEEYAPPWRELNWDEENVPRMWIAT